MDWLLLIPVTAAAIGLYVWFRPVSDDGWPEMDSETDLTSVPYAEREIPAAALVLHAAEQKDPSALISSR